tara:strand:+ start:102 stop:422 length:321 start_codon:yes stop_codon:yes gene_type:complete
MKNKIEKEIQLFVEGIGGIVRQEIVHGTLYVKLEDDSECDFYHKEIRTFYKENINPEGGVNMYFVGDEFCFDFVPAEDEAPSFDDEPLASKIDTALELEADMEQGK